MCYVVCWFLYSVAEMLQNIGRVGIHNLNDKAETDLFSLSMVTVGSFSFFFQYLSFQFNQLSIPVLVS